MMKTADLVAGPQTDALVALAQDWEVERYRQGWRVIRGKCIAYHIGVVGWGNPVSYSPSTTRAQWAELIEEFEVGLSKAPKSWGKDKQYGWQANILSTDECNVFMAYGLSPALAICKAVIAAKWGDVIPDAIWEKVK